MKKAMMLFTLISATSGLKLERTPVQTPPKELEWPLLIDGRDAHRGPHAYDKDGMQEVLDNALPFVMTDTLGDLTIEVVEQLHKKCCHKHGFRPNHMVAPIDEVWAMCLLQMSCEEQQVALADVPRDLLQTEESTPGCYRRILSLNLTHSVISQKFYSLIMNYSNASKQVLRQGASFEVKLATLARMLRNLAWLHPFHNFNGRFRTLLLQREIRRLGLGSGAFMYNNNRDIFYIGLDAYISKIIEGIRIYNMSMQIKRNAWLDEDNVRNHFKQFPAPGNGTCKTDFRVGGGILKIPGFASQRAFP